jgi:hypothetical protein
MENNRLLVDIWLLVDNTIFFQEWRRKWQIGSRWACAEVDELIRDMKDIHANVRFQAVVVCSRAAEFMSNMKPCESAT